MNSFNAFACLSKIYLLLGISISGISIKCKSIIRDLPGGAPTPSALELCGARAPRAFMHNTPLEGLQSPSSM